MPPPITTVDCQDVHRLTDALSGEGGIAEFILPLVANNHITERIIWVKPPWSNQFEDGDYVFRVGDVKSKDDRAAVMGVTCCEPYYFDDGIVYEESELMNVHEVKLSVSTGFESIRFDSVSPWILDICLDYFYTKNPFVDEMNSLFEKSGVVDPLSLLHSFRRFFSSLRFRRSGSLLSCQERRIERMRFLSAFSLCVQEQTETAHPHERNLSILSSTIPDLLHSEAHRKTDACYESLKSFLDISSLSEPDFLRAVADFVQSDSIPTAVRHRVIEIAGLVLLPDSSSSFCDDNLWRRSVSSLISDMADFVIRHDRPPPVAICIARSDGDGYTPADIVETLQQLLLDTLTEALGKQGEIISVFDICDEPYVKAQELLMSGQLASGARFATVEAAHQSSSARRPDHPSIPVPDTRQQILQAQLSQSDGSDGRRDRSKATKKRRLLEESGYKWTT
jgi:hypothetical protein